MRKADLVAAVAAKTKMTQSAVDSVLTAALDTIMDSDVHWFRQLRETHPRSPSGAQPPDGRGDRDRCQQCTGLHTGKGLQGRMWRSSAAVLIRSSEEAPVAALRSGPGIVAFCAMPVSSRPHGSS